MADIIQRALNGGEVCDDAWARNDIERTGRGFQLGRNGLCLLQGPLEKRRGFWYVGDASHTNVPFRLKAFTRKSRQTVVLELGNGAARVWGLDRQRVGAFEIAIPFPYDEIYDLRFTQSGDALYIFRRSHAQPQVLKRLDTEVWTCTPWTCRNGPWLPEFQNDGLNLTITSAGQINASGAFFDLKHIGALFRVKPPNGYFDGADGWRSEWNPNGVEICTYLGNYYQSDNTAKKCGANAPVHRMGTVKDGTAIGDYGVAWTYIHDGKSTFKVNGYGAPNVISGVYQDAMCVSVTQVTGWWSEGAYSDYRGWPSMAPCVHQKRFVTGSTDYNPSTLDMSQIQGFTADFADYTPGRADASTEPDDAIRMEVTGSGAELHWAVSFQTLFVGADDGVWAISSGSVNKTITPSDNIPELVGALGADPVDPAVTPESLIYVAINGRVLCSISDPLGAMDFDANISLVFAHLTGRGVKQTLYMKAPYEMLVLVLADGGFAFVTYNRKQSVIAATTQSITGCTIIGGDIVPGADGIDQLWLAAARGAQRLILAMAGPDEDMFLDLAEKYSGAKATNIGGLDHLKGATVSALADGRWHDANLVVSNAGFVNLPAGYGAENAVFGLPIDFRFEDMPVGQFQQSLVDAEVQLKEATVTARATHMRVGSTDDMDGDSALERYLKIDKTTNLPVEQRLTHKVVVTGWRSYNKRFLITDNSPFALKIFSISGHVE